LAEELAKEAGRDVFDVLTNMIKAIVDVFLNNFYIIFDDVNNNNGNQK